MQSDESHSLIHGIQFEKHLVIIISRSEQRLLFQIKRARSIAEKVILLMDVKPFSFERMGFRKQTDRMIVVEVRTVASLHDTLSYRHFVETSQSHRVPSQGIQFITIRVLLRHCHRYE